MRFRGLFLLPLLAVLPGCDHSPTEPEHRNPPSLHAACVPEGARVSCTATLFGVPNDGSPSTLSYRVDSPIGPAGGNPPFLDVRLRRTP